MSRSDRIAPARVSRVKQTLAVLLNTRPGDGWPLLILLAHSFLKGAARVLLETPANSLFLSRFSIGTLPLTYIATAIVCALIGLVYARLESRISVKALLTVTLAFLSVVTLAFYLSLSGGDSRPAVFGTMVWKDVHWMLMNLEFWALAGLLLDVRQGKRLFGMIALGEIVAVILGGFSVPMLLKTGSTQLLLLLSAVITTANVGLLVYTFRRWAGQTATLQEETKRDRKPWRTLLKDRYIALFFAVTVLSTFGWCFIDYLFCGSAERAFVDEARLAAFFGPFYGVLGVGQLISSAWVSGRFLTRYGLSFGLLALPVAALATTGAASISEILQAAVVVSFWAIVAARFFDEIIRDTIEIPAFRILYQPLPAHQRLRVQTIRDSMVEPTSIGLAGLVLWSMQKLFAPEPLHVLYLTLLVALAWVSLSWILRREYTVRLTRALTARRLGAANLSLDDQSSISVLEQGFGSANAGQVIYCLDLIEEAHRPSLERNLLELLDHPDPSVRSHVLGKIERMSWRDALDPIVQRLTLEGSPDVRAALLRTLCALGEADVLDRIIPYLKEPEPAVRRGALVGLLRHCGIDGVLAGGSYLNGLLTAAHSSDRQLAAEVLGEIGIASFYRPLLALLHDESMAVRLAAIDAARKLRAPGTIPALLEALAVPTLRAAASAALVEIGDVDSRQFARVFAENHHSLESLESLARICGRIGNEAAAAFLRTQLSHPDGFVRTQILSGLVRCREKTGHQDLPEAKTMIASRSEEAAWALAAWTDLEADTSFAELSGALLGEVDDRKEPIFLLLALIYPPAVIRQARLDLETIGGEKKAHALEVLDNLLTQELKKLIFPLVDNLSPRERARRLHAIFHQSHLDARARLRETLTESDRRTNAWTKACALYVAGKSRAAEWSPLAAAEASNDNAVVRETAIWTLAHLDPSILDRLIGTSSQDPSVAVVRHYRELLQKDTAMLLTIEKVIILKSVSIFSDISERGLIEAATVLEEIRAERDETIIEQGDTGNSLYIVVEGKVHVHDREKTIATLGPGEVFGELAALDPEPRMASVTVMEPALFLRMGHDELAELMSEHPQLAIGIIRVLCRRLRARPNQAR